MVMSDTRLIGVDSGGYPAQPDADAIIRQVDNELMQAMDLNVPLLTMFGGLSGFTVNNVKHFWVEDDLWRRRITSHGSLSSGTPDESLTLTGQAHRYPIGTILECESELLRIKAIIDANTVTVDRAYAGSSAASHSANVGLVVAGSSMSENDNWIYRPTPVVSLPYNYCQMDHVALRNSWRRQQVRMYGRDGAVELDELTAQTLAQKTVAIEGALVRSLRYVGASGAPATSGGMKYYITSANGADVTDKSGAALTLTDLYSMIHRLVNVVGMENVGRTIITGRWGKEKISSFFAGSRRMTREDKVGGSVINMLDTEWGEFKILMHYALDTNDLFLVNDNFIKVGHLGSVGLLHVGETMETAGPFSGRYIYSDYTFQIKNIPTMGRIHNFSSSS
jgi:hypothetical protein